MTVRSTIPHPVMTGAEVKRRRELLKLAQPGLADMMGMHEQTLSKMERGKMAISFPNARHFGLLFAWIERHGATVELLPGDPAPASAPLPTQAVAPLPLPPFDPRDHNTWTEAETKAYFDTGIWPTR